MLLSFEFILKVIIISFIIVRIVDFILNKLIPKNSTYFLLHFIFNLWVSITVFNDVIFTLINPLKAYTLGNYCYSGIVTTLSIMSFHINHLLFYSNLSTEDWIHHIVSSLLVPLIGIFLPFGTVSSLSNIAMCGLPGGIDYFLLFLVKMNVIHRMTEKKINRFLNLLLRWPFMFLASYIFIINVINNNITSEFMPVMIFGILLHSINAIYYCDKVIGNYYIKSLN